MCEKSFFDKRGLARHSRIHSGTNFTICPICKGKYTHGSLSQHLKSAHGEQRQLKNCNICGGNFVNLPHHMLTHNSEKVTCQICKKEYNQKLTLLRHMKIHMDRKRDFPCNICQKSFLDKRTLNTHHVRTHTDTGKKACPVCAKQCLLNNLARHIETHSNAAKVTCQVCSKQYKSNLTLALQM